MDTREDEQRIFPRISRRGLLDGIVIQSADMDEMLIEQLLSSDFPAVMVGRPFFAGRISYIDVDNIKAAANAIHYLIQLGYKRIGTITGRMNSTAGIDRLEGYRKALIEHSWVIDGTLIAEGDFTEESGYLGMKKLLQVKPDAVFVASDSMAFGAIRAVKEAGFSIPLDVALIGFDDLPIATQSDVKLTTIRQPIVQFGARQLRR
jgi:LacI family transcriptional regulator